MHKYAVLLGILAGNVHLAGIQARNALEEGEGRGARNALCLSVHSPRWMEDRLDRLRHCEVEELTALPGPHPSVTFPFILTYLWIQLGKQRQMNSGYFYPHVYRDRLKNGP